jgi:hypothetical protein
MERQFDEGRFWRLSASRRIGSVVLYLLLVDRVTHVFHVEFYPHVNLIKVKRRDSENKQDKSMYPVNHSCDGTGQRTVTQCRPKICIFR